MKNVAALAAFFGMVTMGAAHMEMKDPPPYKSKFNPNTIEQDYSMTNPLNRDGTNFPCKGYHSVFGTPEGASVATWTPGQSYSMTITGGTAHNGGSCQASLSYDGGNTWKTIHSYIGNCPVVGDSTYDFALPNDTPAGEAIFAWTWFNNLGNREMYMNCATVTIGGAKNAKRAPEDPFSSRPDMFVANVGNECSTIETFDLEFPNPGPDVTRVSSNTKGPEGAGCATAKRSTPAAFAKGDKCDSEGTWNCVEGTEFQRCTNGKWTGLEQVYPGTKCEPGQVEELIVAREKSPAKNYEKVMRAARARQNQV